MNVVVKSTGLNLATDMRHIVFATADGNEICVELEKYAYKRLIQDMVSML